jgi:hypothetical protein
LCEEVPRQKAAESRKIPESGSVIPREGVESYINCHVMLPAAVVKVIPREGVERVGDQERDRGSDADQGDPE